MKRLKEEDIKGLDRVSKLNIINSITGIKPANLIGTVDNEGKTNLAIISSVVHLGSEPAILGFVLRPSKEVRRHSHENIIENSSYTINHVPTHMIKNAHYTSAKFEKDISEFKRCGFTEQYISGIKAPFVKESNIQIGMEFLEEVPIKINDTALIIGKIVNLSIKEEALSEQGYIDLEKAETAGISGLNSYYKLSKLADFPYARVNEVPDFN